MTWEQSNFSGVIRSGILKVGAPEVLDYRHLPERSQVVLAPGRITPIFPHWYREIVA